MMKDPVVDEVRRNGARLAEACGGDIHRMAEHLRKAATDRSRRVVCRHGDLRRPVPSKPGDG
jgi:hypothetical protein